MALAACGEGGDGGRGGGGGNGSSDSSPRGTTSQARIDPGLGPRVRPNFVVVLTDDQTLDQFGPEVMPGVWEFFEDRGTVFDNAIVTSPLCCPARASLFTGQYAHNHGIVSNSYVQLRQPANILPRWLQRRGYRTAHVGKYMNNFEATTNRPERAFKGWDQWYTQLEPQRYHDYRLGENGKIVRYRSNKASYLTRVLNDRSERLVRRFSQSDEPFYLQLDQYAPHTSGGRSSKRCRHAAVPADRDRGMVTEEGVPVPAESGPAEGRSFNEADISDKPGFLRDLRPLTKQERVRARVHYACAVAALQAVDRGFVRLVEALEETGELDDTVFVFTSDNGYYYGEHRIPGEKHFPYDEGLRVPLAISLPESLVAARSRPQRVSAAVANIDIAPTMLALARVNPCSQINRCRAMDGRSLLPLLAPSAGLPGVRAFADRALGIELGLRSNGEPFPRVCRFTGARKVGRVVIEHLSTAPARGECRPSDQLEHYDLTEDPAQVDNLVGPSGPRRGVDAGDQLAGRQLLRRMRVLRRCSGVRGRDARDGRRPHCE